MRRLLIRILFGIIIALLLLEVLLRLFDPLGLVYLSNMETLSQSVVPSPTRGYELAAGRYMVHGWSATELDNGVRYVPANQGGVCSLIFAGDSVTWSEGVDDDQTWVNLVAKQLPGVNVVDPAFIAYNSENVRGIVRDFPNARAIIYLIFYNDPAKTIYWSAYIPHVSATLLYILYLTDFAELTQHNNDPVVGDWPRFYGDLDAMHADGRVTFVTFDDTFGRDLATRYPVRLIPMYTKRISVADPHANVEGNQQIAAAMLPIARDVVKDKCGG